MGLPDNVPAMGVVPGVANAYLCAGHNTWGILQGPASALAIAELVLYGQARSVDLAPFTLARFQQGQQQQQQRVAAAL